MTMGRGYGRGLRTDADQPISRKNPLTFIGEGPDRSVRDVFESLEQWLRHEGAKIKRIQSPTSLGFVHGSMWKGTTFRDSPKVGQVRLEPRGLGTGVEIELAPGAFYEGAANIYPERVLAGWSEFVSTLWKRLGDPSAETASKVLTSRTKEQLASAGTRMIRKGAIFLSASVAVGTVGAMALYGFDPPPSIGWGSWVILVPVLFAFSYGACLLGFGWLAKTSNRWD